METTHRYPLDKLIFNFIPDDLPMPDIAGINVDRVTANDIYRQAHRMVYNEWPKNELGKNWQKATANAKLAQMDFKTFCLYIITGHAITHKFTPFFPVNLSAGSSIAKVEAYRLACMRKFGASDARSLGLLLNLEFFDIDEEMLLSEINFGRYITGNMIHTGKSNLDEIYKDEITFSPYWLVTERTYIERVFAPYLEKVSTTALSDKHTLGTEAQLRHRHLISQVIGALKRRSHIASTIHASRSRIMPNAVKSVLERHGMKTITPISDTVDVDEPFEFWQRLGYKLKVKNNGRTDTL